MPFRVDLKDLAIGGTGAGLGAGAGELAGEFAARMAKQTGWAKFGIKAAVKAVIGALLYGASYMTGGVLSYLIKMAGFGSFGGIVIDLIATIYPGGIPGAAEKIAAAVSGAGAKAAATIKIAGEEEYDVSHEKESMIKALGYRW